MWESVENPGLWKLEATLCWGKRTYPGLWATSAASSPARMWQRSWETSGLLELTVHSSLISESLLTHSTASA